jgi:hypothetical protein
MPVFGLYVKIDWIKLIGLTKKLIGNRINFMIIFIFLIIFFLQNNLVYSEIDKNEIVYYSECYSTHIDLGHERVSRYRNNELINEAHLEFVKGRTQYYNIDNNIVMVKDENGKITRKYFYDNSGKVLYSESYFNNETSTYIYEYNEYGFKIIHKSGTTIFENEYDMHGNEIHSFIRDENYEFSPFMNMMNQEKFCLVDA